MTEGNPVYASAPLPNPRQGRYAITVDGVVEHYPRVTTILGIIARPGIEAWRQRVGTEEANRIAQEAAGRGTRVHQITEAIDRNQLTDCPPELLPFVRAYCAWKDAYVARVELIEQTVYHQRFRYAGTLDRVFLLKSGARVLADLKTGKTVDGIYRLQQIAYVEALEEMGDPGIDQRLILHLPSSQPGTLRMLTYDEDEQDRRAWRAALRLFKWHARHQHDWKISRNGGTA